MSSQSKPPAYLIQIDVRDGENEYQLPKVLFLEDGHDLAEFSLLAAIDHFASPENREDLPPLVDGRWEIDHGGRTIGVNRIMKAESLTPEEAEVLSKHIVSVESRWIAQLAADSQAALNRVREAGAG